MAQFLPAHAFLIHEIIRAEELAELWREHSDAGLEVEEHRAGHVLAA
jgi:hypothetical protein